MASIGGYIRFGLGIILSLEIFREALMGQGLTGFALALAALFLASSAIYFIKRLF